MSAVAAFFGIHFGSIEIKICGQSRAIDTYFWIQTLGGGRSTKSLDNIHTFISNFFDELPYSAILVDEKNLCKRLTAVHPTFNHHRIWSG